MQFILILNHLQAAIINILAMQRIIPCAPPLSSSARGACKFFWEGYCSFTYRGCHFSVANCSVCCFPKILISWDHVAFEESQLLLKKKKFYSCHSCRAKLDNEKSWNQKLEDKKTTCIDTVKSLAFWMHNLLHAYSWAIL